MASKILLVEDDNNLREIYEARLQAEGYVIVTARDGEEALGVAKSEVPDLVISDVMMPRVSGFEMLDILRNTDNLKDVKVIMLTALGQADDKTRANSLGADRYLVKSQVTLEDIVKTAHELLEGSAPQPAAPVAASPVPTTTPVATAPDATTPTMPAPPVMPAAAPAAPLAVPSAPMPTAPVPAPAPAATPVSPVQSDTPQPAMPPLPGMTPPAAAMPAPMPIPTTAPTAPSVSEEKAAVGAQINDFIQNAPNTAPATVQTNTTARDDAVLADAVEDLAASSSIPSAPMPTAPVPAPAPAPVAAPTPSQSPVTTPVAPIAPPGPQQEVPPQATSMGSVPIANKKVIQPLSSPEPKPSIHELAAREEANTIIGEPAMPPAAATSFNPAESSAPAAPPTGPVVGGPGAVPAPGPQPPAPSAQPTDFDPNNISL